MKNTKKIISLLCVGLFSVSCKHSQTDNVIWSAWYDNGDGTHTRYDTNQIAHIETEDHKLVFQNYIVEPTDKTPGEAEYVCSECSAHIHQHLKPIGNYTYDQEVVDPTYIYEKRSEHTAIYYKSSVEGAYGDPDALFEVSDLPKEYSEIDGITSNGIDVIETPFDVDEKYEIILNNKRGEDTLPSSYKELEFLEVCWFSFFDTGIHVSTETRVIIDVELMTSVDFPKYLVCTDDERDLSYFAGYDSRIGHFYYQCFEDSFDTSYSFPNSRFVFDVYGNGKIAINNEILRNSQEFPSKSSEAYIYLFGNKSDSYTPRLRMFSGKIYEGETLVRDYVPAYTLPNRAVGLYDKVNGTFTLSTSNTSARPGPEVYSSNKANFKEDYVLGNVQEMPGFKDVYPDYLQVDYLLSNTTQYIVTQTRADKKRYEFDIQMLPNGAYQFMGIGGTNNAHFGLLGNSWFLIGNSQNVPTNARCKIYYDVNIMNEKKTTTWINNSTSKYIGREKDDDSWQRAISRKFQFFNIGAYSENNPAYFLNSRMYDIRVFNESNEELNHYLPVLSKKTGEAGLIDIITGTFFPSEIYPFSYGSTLDPLYDNTKINIFTVPWSQYMHPIVETINDFTIVDTEANETVAQYIPAMRNSDAKIGFYDIVSNEFLPIESDSFTYGKNLSHMFGKETVVLEPTHDIEGESVKTCQICGEVIHTPIPTTAHKVTFDLSETTLESIKVFDSPDPEDFHYATAAYSRNIKTYNYSRYNSFVSFEVPSEYKVTCSSGTLIKDGTKYRIEDIRRNIEVRITPKQIE